MQLMFDFPEIRDWVMQKTASMSGGVSPSDHMRFSTPQLMEAAVAAVYQLAHEKSPTGDAVRAALSNAPGKATT